MKASQRVVLDTNTLISGVLLVESIPGRAVRKAITDDHVLIDQRGRNTAEVNSTQISTWQ